MNRVEQASDCEPRILESSSVFFGYWIKVREEYLDNRRWINGSTVSIAGTAGARGYRLLSDEQVVA